MKNVYLCVPYIWKILPYKISATLALQKYLAEYVFTHAIKIAIGSMYIV